MADAAPIRVVISYRRDDSAGYAGRLYSDLVDRLGEDSVFIDIDNIDVGLDFAEVISTAIKSSDVLIAIVGPTWLSAADKRGRRKVDKSDDFVRLEIEGAIKRKLRIIPVLVQDAEMPSPEDLPPSMATFARRNALDLSNKRWRTDVNALVQLLDDIAREKAERRKGQEVARKPRRPSSPQKTEPSLPDPSAAQEAQRRQAEQAAQAAQAERERRWAEEQARREHEAQVAPDPPRWPVGAPASTPRATAPDRPIRSTPWLIGAMAGVVVLALVGVLLALNSGGGGPSTTTTVTVPGNMDWTDSGVVLSAGQEVEIVASGMVDTNSDNPNDTFRDAGPDGIATEKGGDNNIVRAEGHGGLIGRIGPSGEPFAVGARTTFQAGPDGKGVGRLYLGINDIIVTNNSGAFAAIVTVK